MKKLLICLGIIILAASLVLAMGENPPEPKEYQAVPQEEIVAEEAVSESAEEDSYQYEDETAEEIPQDEGMEIY